MKLFVAVINIFAAGVLVAKAQVDPVTASPSPESPFQPDLTPGYALVEGDIQIPVYQYMEFVSGLQAKTNGGGILATFGGVTFWPNGVVPYDFVTGTGGNGDVTAANQTAAINAMTNIAARAGVTFRPAVASDANRIRFQNSTFNNSPVGVQGGAQIINIVNWGTQIIICHEIYHSLGFWHEQSRSDRDTYITVNTNSICGTGTSGQCAPATCQGCQDSRGNWISCAYNFNIQSGSSTYGPYDFDSIMHYGPGGFSCNGNNTITVKAPWDIQYQNVIGQRSHISYFDAITCRALYPFADDRWLDKNFGGFPIGTFDQPYKNTQLAGALAGVPGGGTLLIKYGNNYSAVGTYTTPVTIMAPDGAVVLGN